MQKGVKRVDRKKAEKKNVVILATMQGMQQERYTEKGLPDKGMQRYATNVVRG